MCTPHGWGAREGQEVWHLLSVRRRKPTSPWPRMADCATKAATHLSSAKPCRTLESRKKEPCQEKGQASFAGSSITHSSSARTRCASRLPLRGLCFPPPPRPAKHRGHEQSEQFAVARLHPAPSASLSLPQGASAFFVPGGASRHFKRSALNLVPLLPLLPLLPWRGRLLCGLLCTKTRTETETKETKREEKRRKAPKPWPRPPRSHVPLSRAGRGAEGQRSTEGGHTVSLSQRALSPPSWPWGSPSPRASHRQPRDSPLPAQRVASRRGRCTNWGRCKLEPTLSSGSSGGDQTRNMRTCALFPCTPRGWGGSLRFSPPFDAPSGGRARAQHVARRGSRRGGEWLPKGRCSAPIFCSCRLLFSRSNTEILIYSCA